MPLVAVYAFVSLAMVGQAKPDPRIMCPANASNVELPAAHGVRVLRCVDDTDGQPNGVEIWLAANGFFVQRGSWERGIRGGLWERWYTSGHLMSRITYDRGQLANATCLTETKRKEFECTPDYYPADWAPPPPEGGAPPPAAAPAPAGAAPTPEIAPMPGLPPAPPPSPTP